MATRTGDVPSTVAREAGVAYVDGRYLPIGEASIPITDWGFIRGDAVYDAIPFTRGFLFRLSDHVERFGLSMRKWRLHVSLGPDRITAVVHEVVRRSGLRDGLVLIMATRGVPPSLGIRDPARFENRFYAFSQVLPPIAAPERLRDGMSVIVSRVRRIPETSVDSTAKNFQWGDFTQARLEANDRGADNALLLDHEGNVTEGPGFNAFIVSGGTLKTPAHHRLEGITRRTVMEIAERAGWPVSETDVPVAEMMGADEVFLCTSAGGIFPVTEIDGLPVADGTCGEITSAVLDRYWRLRVDPEWAEAVEYVTAASIGSGAGESGDTDQTAGHKSATG